MKDGSEEKVNPAAAPSAENAAPEGDVKKAKGSRRGKIWRWVLLIFAILLVALGVFVLLLLDHTLRVAICKVGPNYTGTPIQMEDLDIDLIHGRVEMSDFKVGNPKGFSHENIFEIGELVCDVDMSTLTAEELVVEEVTIKGLMVAYEPSLIRGSNVKVLQQNIEEKIGKPAEEEKKEEKETSEESEKPAQKIVIRKLRVEGIEIGMIGGLRIPLPPIEMNDLGKDESITETIDAFLTQLLKSIAESPELLKAVGSGIVDLGGAVGDAAKGLGDAAKDLLTGDEKK